MKSDGDKQHSMVLSKIVREKEIDDRAKRNKHKLIEIAGE